MAELAGWTPLYETHAIEVATVFVRFSQPVTAIPWRHIQRQARDVAREAALDVEVPIQEVNLMLAENGGQASVQGSGIQLMRLETPQFAAEKFTVTKDVISFESWRYTRWAGLVDKFGRTVVPVLRRYLDAVELAEVGLEYVDRFNGPINATPECSAVVNKASKYISKSAFHDTDTWHSHSGRLYRIDDYRQRLWNADVDVVDVQINPNVKQRTVRIRTSTSNRVTRDCPDDVKSEDAILEDLETLHSDLKSMLGEILTDSAATSIALHG